MKLQHYAPRAHRVAGANRSRECAGRRFLNGGLTLLELLIVLALIPLAAVFFLACMQRQRGETTVRVRCASNLRQIGQAILLYSNENGGAYPRTIYVVAPSVTPTWGTGAAARDPFKEGGPAPNDVTAALFLLLRTQDITSDVFTCPSSNAEKWDFGGAANTALNWSNWEGREGIRKYLSYSFANPYPDAGIENKATTRPFLNNSISAEFAVASDINPGVSQGRGGVLSVTTQSSVRDMKAGNSPNHEGDGQNVLYGDGHVEFTQNPFVGVQRDNIFCRRAGASSLAPAPGPVAQSPYDINDSVLLPAIDW